MVAWRVPPIWEGGECWIIGGGPSIPYLFDIPEDVITKVTLQHSSPKLYTPFLTSLHDRHVIGVNNAYELGLWVDACFFGDCSWYLVHRFKLAKWPNMKVTCCPRFERRKPDAMEGIKFLKRTQKDKRGEGRHGITTKPGMICWNNNSGASAINLAVLFGAKRVVLLGFDMNMDGHTHWHSGHGKKSSPPFRRHLRNFPLIAQHAKEMGVEVLNASPKSSLDCFKKVHPKELL